VDVRESDLREITRVWNEIAEFSVASSDGALKHALGTVMRLVGATNAFWVGGRRAAPSSTLHDPLAWSVTGMTYLVHANEVAATAEEQRRRFSQGLVDPMTAALIARAGSTRALLRSELVGEGAWRRSSIYNDVFRPLGIGDRLVGAHTIDPHNESYIGVERDRRGRPFGTRERDLLHLFLCGAQAFHRQLLRAEPSPYHLTPREREVLKLLLRGFSERAVARELSLTTNTVHQYVVTILRKFGITNGRVGLMAYFLREPHP